MHWWQIFCVIINTMAITVEFCVEIVKQEAADGQGEAADYMVIFAKKHDGEEGGEIWTPPIL